MEEMLVVESWQSSSKTSKEQTTFIHGAGRVREAGSVRVVGRGRMVLNCQGFKWLNGFKWPRRYHLERILRDLEAIEIRK